MLGVFGFLASYGFYPDRIGGLLSQWEQFGFFSYLLPFLLLFALIFGLLTRIDLFDKSKSVNAIIAFVVSLMALQFEFVPMFFSEIFPRVGVGLVVILAVIILLGLFVPNRSWMTYTFIGMGFLIIAIVLIKTAGALGWSSGFWWYENWDWIVGIIVFLIIIGVIVGSTSTSNQPTIDSPIMQALLGTDRDRH